MIRTLAAAAKAPNQVNKLILQNSEDLKCKNMMCSKFDIDQPAACVCKLARFIAQNSFLNLTRLDISMNNIDVLPDVIFTHLPKMTQLVAANNCITIVPKEISKLQSLEILDLSNNRLKELPWDELSTMKNLQEINLSGNLIDKNRLNEMNLPGKIII